MRFYKRDPNAALAGMAGLTLKQRGAYNALIDLLYANDGDVDDDDAAVARSISCHWREWAAVKRSLIEVGKVRVEGGKLMARRVHETIMEASELSQKQRKNVSQRWAKSKIHNENNNPSIPGGNTSRVRVKAIASSSTPPLRSFDEDLRRVDRLGKSLGIDPTTAPNGHRFIAQLIELESQGIDFDLDLLPVIEERRAAGRIPPDLRALSYFREPALARKQARELAANLTAARGPAPAISDADWDDTMRGFVFTGYWAHGMRGPAPTEEGCRCPKEILAKYEPRWVQQGCEGEDLNFGGIKEHFSGPFWGSNVVPIETKKAGGRS